MKNISKWILASSILAVAFGCQCQTKNSDNDNQEQDQNQGGSCSKSSVEKPAGKSTAEMQKLSAPLSPAVEKSAEKKGPVSATAIPVPEQKHVPTVKEPAPPSAIETKSPVIAPVTSAVTSAGPVAALVPEVKAENATKTLSPANPAVIENQSAPSAAAK